MTNSAWTSDNLNIVDLLCTNPSRLQFTDRVLRLQLPHGLESKVIHCHEHSQHIIKLGDLSSTLTKEEEEVLATEVLYYRHRFTQCILKSSFLRQAALTVVQNIFLFQNRHIFFQPPTDSLEEERRQALELFSSSAEVVDLPISQSLRHPILARIWARVVYRADDNVMGEPAFLYLHSIVECLNTLRNIYMLFSSRLVLKLAGAINPVYKQSISYEDAVQIGNFGIARAAYRYHQSFGIRFSTYAANWFYKEIQRQALSGRMIYVSTNTIEKFALAQKSQNEQAKASCVCGLSDAIPESDERLQSRNIDNSEFSKGNALEKRIEVRQYNQLLLKAIDNDLSDRSADIIKRRYGLPPHTTTPQSVVEIAKSFGITRGRVYQIEQDAFKILQKSLLALEPLVL